MKTFYRIFGGKCRKGALLLYALTFSFNIAASPLAPPPSAYLSGGGSVCEGNSIDVFINITDGIAPWQVVYTIDGVVQSPITGIMTSPYTLNTGMAGVYELMKITDMTGEAGMITGGPVSVDIAPLPLAAGMISGAANVCQGSTGHVYSVPAIPYATSYFWSVPTGASIVSGQNTNNITIDYDGFATSGIISVYGVNSCGDGSSSDYYVTVSPLPEAGGAISGLNSVCQNQVDVIYSIAPIANATAYEWELPAGASVTAGFNTNIITVSFGSGASTGNIRARGTNACGNGAWSPDLIITVNPLPGDPGPISGPSLVCQSQTGVTFSVPAISQANGYEWQLPQGAVIVSGSNTNQITVDFSSIASSGDILVRGNNTCGAGQWSAAYAVMVSNVPLSPGSISGSANACQNQTGLVYSIVPVAYATSYEWEYPSGFSVSGPDNSISVSMNTSSSAVSGIIRVRAVNSCGNGPWSGDFNVDVIPGPTSGAGIDNTICAGSTFSLSGTATQYSSVAWSTSGDGTFSNSGILNPVYTPGSGDISNGNVNLTLTANGNGSCSPVLDAMVLTIAGQPSVNAGSDGSMCYSAASYLLNGTASGHSSVQWQAVNGTGTFTNPSNPVTSYSPSIADIAQGYVTLQLTAYAMAPCTTTASDQITVTISSAPVANAGPDVSSCGTNPVYLSGNAQFSGNVEWITDGSGTFSDRFQVNSNYTPSLADVASGSVRLTLRAFAAAPCSGFVSDEMILTLSTPPVVNAGNDASICETSGYTLTGSTASNYSSVLWVSDGSGIFSNPSLLHPTYTPSIADITGGSVILTLTATGTGNCAAGVQDQMTLYINRAPFAYAGPAASVCELSPITINDATASGYSTLSWTTSGTGTFINSGTLNPTYTPSMADAIAGSVYLTLTATPVLPCTVPYVSVKTLNIMRQPVVNAGQDDHSCGNTPYTLSGATASNYTSIVWSASGSGSFINPSVLNATYIPGANDIIAGSVTLTLNVTGNAPCSNPVSDNMILTLGGEPVAYAGIDGLTCETNSFTVTTATASNYSSVNWTTNGTGTLTNAGSLNPTYIPSHNDAVAGIVTLTMSVTGIPPCNAVATDVMQISITPSPVVNAGVNFSVCGNSSFVVAGASAQYYSSLTWTSSGTGNLVNANQINPTYTPSATDVANGSVTLTLTAHGNAPCVAPVSSAVLVTINQIPVVFAGNDMTICDGPHNVTGATAGNYSSLMWTSAGDGLFTNPTSLTPIYTPGPGDNINGLVTLTLTATSLPPCTDMVMDNVIFYIQPQAQVFAGPNANVCEGSIYELINATASGYSSLTWSTSGSGNFNNINILNPTYTPGMSDIANGAITLTLTATNPPCLPRTSDMVLSIRRNPVANAGSDALICEGSSYTVNNASAPNSSSVMWVSNGSGTLLNPTTLMPTYVPSAADIMSGTVRLTLTATAIAPCMATSSDIMEITITRAPYASAGNDATICANQTHTISGSNAGNYSSLAWSSSGDGTFLAGNTLYPTYIPGIIDESLGYATLTLTAYGIDPCNGNATDQMMLTVVPVPVVNAGPDIQICVGSNVLLTGTSAQSTSSVYWSTSGSGSFSDPTLINPVYTPSPQDITNGSVILMITGQGVLPCTTSASDIMTLQISQPPVVNAGSDGEICATGQYYIFDASATNYSAITWTTMGDGTFSNHNSINPTYTPGQADIAAGSVLLYLNATSLLPCSGSVSDAMLLTIHPMPNITAGPDAATCEGDTYLIAGATALEYSNLQWTSSGSGWFSNNAALNPIYTPSAVDIINGSITLTLTATGLMPCTGQVTDQMVLTIRPRPIADAGTDQTICVGSYTITTASASNYSTLQWVSDGSSGTLLNATTITPTYMPSPADIANGSVVLTLTANANTPCAVPAVDQMVITIRPLVVVDAGQDETICEGSTFTPNTAFATNYTTINWTTSGTGSFINAGTLTPTYTPSPADIALGWVTLSLTGTSVAPCNQSVSDNIILTIRRQAVVDAGLNSTICESGIFTTSGASAVNHTSIQWTTNGTGVFANPAILVTTYSPSLADIANGTVILTLTAGSMAPCAVPVSDFLVLTIKNAPLADAGTDAAICESGSYFVTTSSAANYSSLQWTTSGNGTFVDGTTLNPTYTPGSADIAAGSAVLTLTAQPESPCSVSASDSFILTVNRSATANAGADASVCEGTGLLILDASAANYSFVAWTTSGSGTFSNANTLNPTYFPSPDDVINGSVILSLTAYSSAPCAAMVTDTKVVTVVPLPEVNAGPDGISCGLALYNITGANATDFASLQWTTSGTGVFTNPSLQNPSYQPSAADLLAGSVTLTLTAISASPCPVNPSDSFELTLQQEASANAGADASVCEGNSYTVFDAVATNYASVNWTHTGTGSLINGNTLSPTYTPSAADAIAGSVSLILNSFGVNPCGNASDTKILTISPLPLVNAGPDASICFGAGYDLSLATAQHYSSVIWSTSGSGSFSNPSILHPVYTPSAADLLAGQVILTLTANSVVPCSGTVSDFMILMFETGPTSNAGADETICEGSTFTVTTASASNYLSLLWITSGDGSFAFANTLTPTYTPGTADLLTGFVTLTLKAYGNPPCTEFSDAMVLTFAKPVIAQAGADVSICEGGVVIVADAAAQNYVSVLWTTNGTGTLANANTLTPTYTPGVGDAAAGSVNLTLTAFGQAPCNGQATDMKVITIVPAPQVNAGPDASLCQGNTHTINGSTASGTSQLNWTTSGTGSFSGNGTLTPTYTPSFADFISGSVILTLTGNAVNPCSVPATDAMILTLIPAASVNAGIDATICETGSYTISTATASNYSSLVWTSSGTGLLSNPTTLTPTYTPGAGDLAIGSVTLTLTAISAAPCSNPVNDQMIITFSSLPEAYAGADATICEGQQHTITGATATTGLVFTWSSNGSGSFLNNNTLIPTYIPSTADIATGSVTITLTVQGTGACAVAVTDDMVLNIDRMAAVNAGPDTEICQGMSYTLTNATASNYAAVTWTTSGSGTFSNPAIVNATYNPSAVDISNGSVVLTLTATAAGVCSGSVSDLMTLSFTTLPLVNAGPDVNTCDAAVTINGATASNYSSLLWTSSGTGTLSNATTLSPTYVPSGADIANGFVDLTLTALANLPCTGSSSDVVRINLNQGPVVNAGNDGSICAGSTFAINGASAGFASLLTWTTSGSGTFSNSNILNPVYTPGTTDLVSGSVILTLTASPIAPCSIPVSDNITLSITPMATAFAGTDDVTCSNSYLLTGATATNYSSFTWTTSGSGSFINQTTLTPTYLPGAADFANGSVILTLEVMSMAPCTQLVTDAMTLTLMREPLANAGIDASVCEGSTFMVTTATASNFSNLNWTSSGSGSFSGQNTLNPVYTPGAQDIANGSVVLTITATAASPCSSTVSDQMTLTIQRSATANAGSDAAVCEGNTYTLSGTVSNSTLFSWSTNGTGSFANGSTLTPVYTPGVADIAAGSVTITLTAFASAPCNIPATDQMILTITPQPLVNAGIDATSCGSNFAITTAIASNYNTLTWTTTGTGTFINPNSINPTYVASLADMSSGSVTLTLTASGSSPCTSSVSDQMVLLFAPAPTVSAGNDDAICGSNNYLLSGASASNYSTLTWSTSGTGTFSNTTMVNPVYYPSAADITSGSVILTLTATSLVPCNTTASDEMALSFNRNPLANAGPDANSCGTVAYQITGATASNYSGVYWTHNGSGTISNANTLNPVYTPSQGDVTTGQVMLTLHATAMAPCTGEATDVMVLNLQPGPLANAGADVTICEGQSVNLNSATASGYATLLWSTSGSGTFSNTTSIHPIYYPSAGDIAAGTVNLTLTLQGAPPCNTVASDFMVLTIQRLPVANAGADAVACGSTYQLINASASNYSSVNWITSGSGFFSNSALVNPVYTPSAADISAGSVTLTLTATGVAPCNNQAADQMILSIGKAVLANAGADGTTCGSVPFTVSTSSASNFASINWTTSGTGTFTNQTTLYPTYTPGAADVSLGSVTLTMSVQGNAPCFSNVQDNMLLTINAGATANAGPDAQICTGTNFTVSGASANNYVAINWTSTGTGTLVSANTLTPTYIPSAQDYLTGNVILTLSVISAAPCSGNVSDEMMLSFISGPVANAGPDAEICFGVNYTVTGASASGYQSINWTSTGSGTLVNQTSINPTYMPSNADRTAGFVNLIMTVQGAAPCFGTVNDVMMLSISSMPVAAGTISGPQQVCAGQTGVGYSVTPVQYATGYNWVLPSGATIVSGANTSNILVDFSVSAISGNIYVNATSACGNGPVSAAFAVTVSPLPGNPGMIMGPSVVCQNTSGVIYSINPVSGADAYQWTVPAGAAIVTGNGTNSITVDYSTLAVSGNITVSPQNGCGNGNISTLAVTVNPMPAAPVITANGPVEFCEGGSVVLSATPGYASYLWSNGLTTQNITVTAYGTYSVVATDVAGCASLASNEITVNVHMLFVPVITANGPVDLCQGESVVLSAPAGYASYLWNSGQTTQSITVTSSGVYNVVVTDAFGCSSLPSANVTVTVNLIPATPVITASGPLNFCAGDSVTLSAPAGFATYLWSNGETTQSILVTSSGVFTVTVGSIEGCTSLPSAPVTVVVSPYPATPVIVANGPTTFCNGGSVVLTASAGYISYLWSNGETTQSITVTISGTYSVIVTDASGCSSQPSASVTVTVMQPPAPTIVANGSTNICDGGSVQLTAPSGYAGYLWSNGETTQSIQVSVSGSYFVRVSDAAGCISDPSNIIDVLVYPPVPVPVITALGPTNLCDGETVVLSAPAGYTSYLWSNGQVTSNILVSTTGNYSVIVTDIHGCSSASSNIIAVFVTPMPDADAGVNTAVCSGSNFTVSGASASNYSMLVWTSSGTGYFINNGNLNPTYVPSAGDIASGSVILTLSAIGNGPCTMAAESSILLSFINEPTVNAGNDIAICSGTNVNITGATAANYLALNWTSSGSGTFFNGNTLTPTYIPSLLDISTGMVSLTLSATPVAPCGSLVSDVLLVTINPAPQVFAGDNTSICPPDQYTTLTATASNYAGLLWSTDGTGSFTNAASLVTVYIPGAEDISNGVVTLSLTAYASGPCVSVSDDMVLFLTPEATANAGADASLCEGSQFLVTGASASNYSSLTWTSSGTGVFVNNGFLAPTYIPSIADNNAGMVILTLTANPVAPCSSGASDALILTIEGAASANAGSNGSVCYGENYNLTDASANSYSDILWTTSGTGSFANPTEINATYIPSADDLLAGNVTLTLTAYGNDPCGDDTDFMVLTIVPGTTVDAGDDLNICFGPAPVTGATASGYSSLQWTISFGTGMLVNAGNIMPVYIPSAGDLVNGYVILTLTANPLAPCSNPVSDNKTITISETPVVDAGLDETICEGSVYVINDASASNYASLQWSSSGTGTWVNINTLNPTYTPSANDIQAGSVVLTLTATNGACPVISDYKQLNIRQEVIVNAGIDDAICEGSSYTMYTATASGYSNLIWSTSGSGSFDNPNSLNPVYAPSAADIAAGSVVLSLTGISSAPCSGMNVDNMILTISRNPVAYAGSNGLVCEGGQYIVADASAFNFTSVIWTSTGTGSFLNGTTLTPTYIPGATDVLAGSVTLTLIVSNPPCADASSSQTLVIIPNPLVNAGPDVTICNSCSHTVSGAMVNNAVSFGWTSTGTGILTGENTLTPTYQPSPGDISNGSVTLILTAVSASGCGNFSDEMVIFINQNPDLDFTWTLVCAGQPTTFMVDTTMTDVNSIAVWHWNFGDGFYANVMNPSHTFPATGAYIVTLTATDTAGYTSIIDHTVEIMSTPVSFFSFDTPNCLGTTTQFHNLSSTENGYITRWVWNFGDGSVNDTVYFPNNPNVVHDFANSGIFEVSLNVINSYGCEQTYSSEITVTPNPVANFYYTTLCEDLLVNFQDASFPNGAGNVVSWAWNFDDPASGIFNTSNLEDPQHIFSAPGIYDVTLIITNFNNCSDTITKQVTVGDAPAVEFTWQAACESNLTSFFTDATVVNINAIATFLWNFGDGGQSNQQDPQHMFAAAGDYIVTLTLTDTSGCVNSVSHLVRVSPAPVAFFSYSEPTCFGNATSFNDQSYTSSGYITEWEWIFGDGNSTIVSFPGNPNVSHTYANAGNYNVTLNITTSEGCENSVTIQVQVIPNPTANFINSTSCLSEPVEFTDLSQANGGGQIIDWAWNFGDPASGINNTSSLQNPSHLYTQAGSYTVSLTVTTSNSCTDTMTKVIVIEPAPFVDFSFTNGCSNDTVQFTSSTFVDPATTLAWFWDFGDGLTATEADPIHVYAIAGIYNVSLTITDLTGCIASVSHFVNVVEGPVAMFSFTAPACAGSEVAFNDISIAAGSAISQWHWDFGDGNSTTITAPGNPDVTHTYASAGMYTVTLTITNLLGCDASSSMDVLISSGLLANFTFEQGCAGTPAVFSDQSNPNGGPAIVQWSWNFGDPASGVNNTSNLQNPTHIFTGTGTYNVVLNITNTSNCTSAITKQITVNEAPPVEFTWESSCANALTSFFTDPSVVDLGAIATFAWDFGDGGVSNYQDPQYQYATAGNYQVTLTITDTTGCSNAVSHVVIISELPVAFFAYSEPTCFETETLFTDLSYTTTGYITEWEWIFGDGNSTTVVFPDSPHVTHLYANSGVYNVTLNITTSNGCENTVTRQVTVIPNPVANFISNVSCLGEPVNFTDLSQTNGGGQIVNWAWNFGDPTSGVNNTSSLQHPSHTYAQPGTYTVLLTVTTANSCTDTVSRVLTIAPAPVVDFTATSGCANDTIQFTSSTFVDMTTTLAWLWEFGDGSTSVLADPEHIYTSHGIYYVRLTITDLQGCTATVEHPVNVVPGPLAMFGFTAPACSGSEVQFNDLSVVNGSVITSWLWNFGDGNTMLITAPGNPNVSHIYANPGVYTVTLTVTNLQGCDASTSIDVVIVAGPIAEFTFNEGCQGSVVGFTDQSVTNGGPAIVQWLWNFGDPASGISNTSNMQHPVHIFNASGTYTVTLSTTSASGCISTVQHTVDITPPPGVAFLITSGTCVSQPVMFEPDTTMMDIPSIASFEWNFGDGTPVSNAQAPVHTYNIAGTYQVTLMVINAEGCSNSITQIITIGAVPVAAFNFSSACTGNITSFNDLSYAVTGEQITGWLWNFNDPNAVPGSDTSSLQNPVYQYSQQGLYDVTLSVTSASGCSGTTTMTVQIFPAPVAAFNYTTNPCANGAVSFQDASTSYMGAITGWEWEFAPGYTSTLMNPYHTFYHTDSCYNVKLMVTDMRGCTDTLIQEVCIPAGLEVAIESNITCHGDTTEFNPVVIAPVGDSLVAFQWNFDDVASGIHNTSTLRNPVHYFENTGSYLVSLLATDENNCQTTVYQRIEVLELPEPLFTYTAGACDSTIYFTDQSSGNGGNISTWIWNYGDGFTDTVYTAPAGTTHFYQTSGIFSVSLTTITSSGCAATYTLDVDRMPCINAVFAQLDTLICERHELSFEDLSVCGNPIDRWEWNFGDGDTLVYTTARPVVSHIYQLSGTYSVSLIVSTTVSGKTVNDTTSQVVKVLASPKAQFTAPDVCLNQNTVFMDQSTWTESKIQSWLWDFGDPNSVYDTTSIHNPAFRYTLPGAYQVMLTITNQFGCTDTVSKALNVFHLPVADFSYSLACQNNHTYFTDISDSADAAIDQWWWKFSDSSSMLGLAGVQHPDFIFSNVGDYEVSLSIIDRNGCADTTMQQITVNPKPISAFSYTENFENTQGRVQFTNGSIGAEAYEWDFGTGILSFEINPVVNFPVDGDYEIRLVTLNEFGCPDTLTMDYSFMYKGLWVPNAFSPNNPNPEVRSFKPVGINLRSYTIEVYDTWGNLMWTSSELDANGSPAEGWNGVYSGNLQNQDTFMWKATGVFKDGTIWRGNDVGNHSNIPSVPYGTITLIR